MICPHLHDTPVVASDCFIAPDSQLIGDVTIGPQSSVWYQCVLRADIESITIGQATNIQDASVIHLSSDLGTRVGDFVTVGHRAILHACSIDNESLIGMGAILMDGVEIGAQCIVGAGSLVTGGMRVPDGSLVMGSPAKVVRALAASERDGIRRWAEKYIQVAHEHRERLGELDEIN